VFNLPCCFFVQQGTRSDHHGHDGQDSLDALPAREVDQRDRAADESVAQHDQEVAEGAAGAEPKYRRREMPTKLAPFVEALDKALKADGHRPRHERRTARALHVELQALGYDGGYTRLTDYIRAWRDEQGKVSATSAFVPLSFELGDAFQFDWSEEGLVIGGIYRRVQLAHLKLCACRAFWLVAYPTQGHEMLFDAHTRSFAALGGIPRRGIYDNMKTAVDKVKKGKGRVVNARFAAMAAHYLFDPDFCNVASGWEKGRVEKNVQDSRRRVWIEAARLRFGSFDELNAWLAVRCRELWQEIRHPEHSQFSVAEMLEHELPQLMPMPEPFDGYVENPARVSSTCLVTVLRNRYSVPCELAGHMVSTRLYPGRVGRGCRRQDRRQPRPAERPEPDQLRLAALHPAGAAQAGRAAQRRALRRHARAAAGAAQALLRRPAATA
jgi:transposase